MPSGKAHAVMSIATASLTYVMSTKSGVEPPNLAVATAVGCALGILLTPDLDVKGVEADSIVRDLGLVPALIWGLIWNPYSAVIPHRSIWSHGLIIGTVIRLVYIGIPLAIVGLLPRPGPVTARIILGVLMSDNIHVGSDFLVTGIKDIIENGKRKKNKKSNRRRVEIR